MLKRDDLLYPELSYQIVGALFDVFNELGPGLRESSYYRATRIAFEERGMFVQDQQGVVMRYKDHIVGRYIPDFVVNQKVVIELKSGRRFNPLHIKQVLEYLKAIKLELAILAYFSSEGVLFKRLINPST